MSDRCFVKVEWDAATSGGELQRAVGGFLRYIQHRDLHPGSSKAQSRVAGMVKYAAYRDGASSRAELFCPEGRAGSKERREFAAFVGRSIEESRPQLFRARDGRLTDRRRAVYRFIISPERAQGLDLRSLLAKATARLETETGASDLRWLAAVHRNTAHHHIHLVVAGMHRDCNDVYHRVELSKSRLASIKEALGLEIERQRGERTTQLPAEADQQEQAAASPRPKTVVDQKQAAPRKPTRQVGWQRIRSKRRRLRPTASPPLVRLRSMARWLAWKGSRDATDEARHRGWEHAA